MANTNHNKHNLIFIISNFSKKNDKSDPVSYSLFFQLCIALILLVYGSLIKDINFLNISALAPNFLILAILYALGNICIFTSLKHIEVSKFTVLFSSRALFSAIGFAIILGNSLTLIQYIGMTILIGAVIIVNLGEFDWKIKKGDYYALLAGLCFGIANINDRLMLQELSLYTYIFLSFFIPSILVMIIRTKTLIGFKTILKNKSLTLMLATIILYTIGALTFFAALKTAESPSKVTTVNLGSVILTVF